MTDFTDGFGEEGLTRSGDFSPQKAVPVQRNLLTNEDLLELQAEMGSDFIQLNLDEGVVLDTDLQVSADRMLAKAKSLQAEIAQILEIGRRRAQDMMEWADNQVAGKQRQLKYLSGVLEYIASSVSFRGKSKSYQLPSGTIGRRKQQPNLKIIDQEAAIKFSTENGIPTKLVEEAKVSELKAYYFATGEIPAGCEVETPKDKPYFTLDS